MTPEHRKRRRQVYIDKQFQLRFILKFCLILLIGIAASSMLLYFFFPGLADQQFHQFTPGHSADRPGHAAGDPHHQSGRHGADPDCHSHLKD